MDYYYKIYGLIIQSEIELPEALQIEKQVADVEIIYGTMPDFIQEKRRQNCYIGLNSGVFKWIHDTIEGSFFMEQGKRIIVELGTAPNVQHTRAILLGPCLGAILQQLNIPAIHGAAVVYKDKAIVISGASGAGKSTLTSELRIRGCQFMADDTVAFQIQDQAVYANPAYKQQKLCKDTAIEFGYDINQLICIQEERDKYAVRLKEEFCPTSKEVAAIVYIDTYDGDKIAVEELKGSARLEFMINGLYTYHDYKRAGMNAYVFMKCVDISKKVAAFYIRRPKNISSAKLIADQIMSLIG